MSEPENVAGTETLTKQEATEASPMLVRFTDFTDAAHNARWRMVNDNVMGGRSLGEVAFADGVMTFAGSINTNGGGFSSTRIPLEPGVLAEIRELRLRVRSDGRPYRLLVEDDLGTRSRRISHRGVFQLDPSVPADQWQTVVIALADLIPTWRGNVMNAEPLRRDLADLLGITLSDGVDGPFRLEVDAIEFVP
ncbi:MAG: CIA30 family protein [Planctomycetota bacterium]